MKKFTAVVTLIFLVLLAIVGPGWIEEHPTAAWVLGVSGVLVILGLALLFGVLLGGTWTRRAMQAGADIALQAQRVNDEWDTRKMTVLGNAMHQGGAIVERQLRGGQQQPALPLPGQVNLAGETMFLPPLSEFGERRSFQVIDQESEALHEDAR